MIGLPGWPRWNLRSDVQSMRYLQVCRSSVFDGSTPTSLEPSRLLNLLKHYFEILGDKVACYEDLRSYTDLRSEVVSDWITFLKKTTHTPVSFSKCRQPSAQVRVVLRYCSSAVYQCPQVATICLQYNAVDRGPGGHSSCRPCS
jgi:hypothetical protein